MAGSHRVRSRRRMSVALFSAATATATALTVGVEPPPAPAKRVAVEDVDLAAAISLLPTHDKVPDITGGSGSQVYDFSQTLLDRLARAIVGGVSLTALAQAAGVDPQSLVDTLLADIPAGLVPGILDALGNSVDLPILGNLFKGLNASDAALLQSTLGLLGTQITDGTLKGLLALLGLDLSDPLNLSNVTDKLGVNIVTAGSPFAFLKMLGIDLGWVPAQPNSVADDINGTPYLKIGVNGLAGTAFDTLNEALTNGTLGVLNLNEGALNNLLTSLPVIGPILAPIIGTLSLTDKVQTLVEQLGNLVDDVTSGLPDVLDTRVTPTIGVGAGAFAAAMAYYQVIADLANQPGGTNYQKLTGDLNPLLGSLTILPLILINNPARPDGGLAARFADLASLLGINAVNPTTHLTGEGGTDVLGTGLHVGGANVLPVLVDATYEYQPLSDFASWPDPVTLANNLAAALLPTYLLRGLGLDDLTPQLDAALQKISLNPVSANIYLTLHSETLPLLEPLYLFSDAMNVVGVKPVADLFTHLANALAPAFTTLINAGYANAVQNPDGTITRDYTTAGTETPFFSFANIDYGKVIGDTISQLIGGFQKEFFSGNPTPGGPNVLSNLIHALLGGTLFGSSSATPASALSETSANSVPSPSAKLLTVASSTADTPAGAGEGSKDGGSNDAAKDPDSVSAGVTTPAAATDEPAEKAADETADATSNATKTEPEKTDPPKTDPPKTEPNESTSATATDTATDPAGGPDTGTSSSTSDQAPAKGPKHAKPESDSGSTGSDQSTGPRHAKPDTNDPTGSNDARGATTTPKHAKPTVNETRDTANDFSPKSGVPSAKDKKDTGDKGAGGATTAAADGTAGSSSSADKAA